MEERSTRRAGWFSLFIAWVALTTSGAVCAVDRAPTSAQPDAADTAADAPEPGDTDDPGDALNDAPDTPDEPTCNACPRGTVALSTNDDACAVRCCDDRDEDGAPAESCDVPDVELDCDDTQAAVHPGGDEVCDGLDNDCNGTVDDDLSDVEPCELQAGVCAGAVKTCRGDEGWAPCGPLDYQRHNPAWLAAERYCALNLDPLTGLCATDRTGDLLLAPGLTPEGAEKALCDGLDNDCDGTADGAGIDIPCYPGDPQETWSDLCRGGARSCDSLTHTYSACEGAQTPRPEDATTRCDGLDQDCDGIVDAAGCPCAADSACYDERADTRGVGICRDGVRRCIDGRLQEACEGSVTPHLETCDDVDVDNDCDGDARDVAMNRTADVHVGDLCTIANARGECAQGIYVCTEQGITCTSIRQPEAETCRDIGVDNDCDGDSADVQVDALAYEGNMESFPDGDRDIDEALLETSMMEGGARCSSILPGRCADGRWSCVNQSGPAGCRPLQGPAPASAEATCNGIDDDCDNATDEGVALDRSPNCGACGVSCAPNTRCCPQDDGSFACGPFTMDMPCNP